MKPVLMRLVKAPRTVAGLGRGFSKVPVLGADDAVIFGRDAGTGIGVGAVPIREG